jgi:hypothetical protein
MSKIFDHLRPTPLAILVLGAPELLGAAERFADGFWRLFCLVAAVGALHLGKAWINSDRRGKCPLQMSGRTKRHGSTPQS